MKTLTFTAFATLTLFTAGCVIVDADVKDLEARYSSDAERVYSAKIEDNTIAIRVAASGCTTKEFFEVDVDRKTDTRFEVEFERKRRDYCKMMQENGELLTWSFSELGLPDGATVSLVNPVGR
jgi:hypothetical protein